MYKDRMTSIGMENISQPKPILFKVMWDKKEAIR
jgi:hypothetical protein